MILQTGGSALGEISTKSNSNSLASSNAFLVGYTPTSTFSPTNLTSGTLIRSLILCGSCLISLTGLLDFLLRIAMTQKF